MKLPSNYYSPISGSLKSIVWKNRPVINPVSSPVQWFAVRTTGSKKIIKYNDYCQFGREERINYIYFASKGNKPTLPSWFCGALGTSLGCLEVWSSTPAGATHLQIFFPCVESESVQPVPILMPVQHKTGRSNRVFTGSERFACVNGLCSKPDRTRHQSWWNRRSSPAFRTMLKSPNWSIL